MTELEKANQRIAALEAQEVELCTLYGIVQAENGKLRADLEAIGAGGVSGPLMDRAADHFPDATKMASRWYMVNKDGMATLCADQADAEQGAKEAQTLWPHMGPHRAVQLVEAGHESAAANAGSEPVAWRIDWPDEPELGHYFSEAPTDSGRCQPLYLHPYPPEGMAGWRPIAEAPKTGQTLLFGYFNSAKKWRTTRGQWMSQDYIDEYAEEPELMESGWHETTVEDDDGKCWPIEPTHWMPLPASPTIEGESNGK